ncbi:hypothetical protein LF934_06950 [Dickeya dadantii]|uniref:hypothetical protein n=1 Tax=Dickeya dadantii TaxID=204038 RepID=UPI001CF2F663|nr:hypothetical protein [Dickeya dadantii]MCA7012383.1 hypothetical protein [Dickeya dadantii]
MEFKKQPACQKYNQLFLLIYKKKQCGFKYKPALQKNIHAQLRCFISVIIHVAGTLVFLLGPVNYLNNYLGIDCVAAFLKLALFGVWIIEKKILIKIVRIVSYVSGKFIASGWPYSLLINARNKNKPTTSRGFLFL